MIPEIAILAPAEQGAGGAPAHADQGVVQAVLLLHSIGLDGRSFAELRATLPRRWRLLTIDMRGHGKSADLPPTADFERHVDDVASAIDRYRATMNARLTLHIAGHSMGGAIAADVAARRDDIASLTVIASPPKGFPAFTQRARAIRTHGMAAAIPETLARWFGGEESEDVVPSPLRLAAYRYAEAALHRMSGEAFANAWDALAAFAGYGSLVAALPPSMLLMGDADLSTPPEVMAPIAEAFAAGGRDAALGTHTIAAAGHMLPLTHAREIAPLLEAHWLANGGAAVTDKSQTMEGNSK